MSAVLSVATVTLTPTFTWGSNKDVDVAEFEEFFLRMRPRLHAYARRWTDVDTANELAIQALTTIWDKNVEAPVDPVANARVESLSFKVCEGLVKNHLRGRARQSRLQLAAANDVALKPDSPGAEDAIDSHERLEALLSGLSPKEREAVEMTVRGYKVNEIASALGTNPGAISMRLKRARASIRTRMEAKIRD